MAYKDPQQGLFIMKNKRDQRRAKGLCTKCSNPSDKYLCEKCYKKKKEYTKIGIKKRASSKLCYYCTDICIQGRSTCLKHYLKQASKNALNTITHWKDLEKLLYDQDYKCSLTGVPISWEDDIELDHIIPLSLRGEKVFNNVRWVLRSINRMRSNMPDDIFKKLLFSIAQSVVNKYQST